MEKLKINEPLVYGVTSKDAPEGIACVIKHTNLICPFCGDHFDVKQINLYDEKHMFYDGIYQGEPGRFYQEEESLTLRCRTCGCEMTNLKTVRVYFYDNEEDNNNKENIEDGSKSEKSGDLE